MDIEKENELRKRIAKAEKNYLISAGAGAGKTEMMSNAVLNRLNSDPKLSPSEVVVITFTNAAAEELRMRINKKYLQQRKNDSSFREINTDDINISTIHSFCSSLVRQRALDCGIGINPEYAEDNDESERIIRQFIRERMNSPDNKESLKVLRKYWGRDTAAIIYNNALHILKTPGLEIIKPPDVISENKLEEEIDKFTSIAKSCFVPMNEELKNTNKTDFTKTKKSIGKINSQTEFCDLLNAATEIESSLADDYNTIIDSKVSKSTKDKKIDVYVKLSNILKKSGIISSSDKSIMPLDDFINDRTARTILFVKNLYDGFEERRKETGLDVNNILYRTAKLMENENAVSYFKKKYKVIFVDEFQDTDYLQLKILLRLCTENGLLRDKSVFLVGDPKQSIYRFRGAEVGFYNYVKCRYFDDKDNSEYCSLSMNFRSQKALVDSVNKIYGIDCAFGYGIRKTKTEYKNMISRPVNENEDNDKNNDGAIISSEIPEPETKNLSELIGFINDLKGKNIRIVKDKDDKLVYDYQKISWGDFLILTSNTYGAKTVYQELKKNGIPAVIAGEIIPGENIAVKRVCALCHYLKERNYLHLAAVIAAFSPNGKFDNANGSMKENNGSIFDKLSDNEIKTLSDMIVQYESIYKEKGPITALYDALMNGWLTDTRLNYISFASELPLLYQFFEGLLQNCSDRIDEICEYADDFAEKKIKRTLNPSLQTDCVRVMNLHQAKGLEGNIVINYLENTAEQEFKDISIRSNFIKYISGSGKDMDIYDKPKVYMSISKKGYGKYEKTKYYHIFDEDTKNEYLKNEAEELIRRMYVRDTRARIAEYVFIKNKSRKKEEQTQNKTFSVPEEYILDQKQISKYEQMIHNISTSPSSLEKQEVLKSEKAAVPVKEQINTEPTTKEAKETTDMFSRIKQLVMGQKINSPSEPDKVPDIAATENTEPAKDTETEIINENEDAEKKQEKRRQNGAKYGTIMHRAFELYLANRKANNTTDEKSLESFVVQAILEVKTNDNAFELYYTDILNNLECFVREFESRYQGAQTAMETPIFCVFDDNDDMMKLIKSNLENSEKASKAFFSGYSDLIVFMENKSYIIDYKSDRKRFTDEDKTIREDDETYKNRLTEKYKPQQEAYAKCFNTLMGNVEQKMTLYTANAEDVFWIEKKY